jgi:hypothetical protein
MNINVGVEVRLHTFVTFVLCDDLSASCLTTLSPEKEPP